MPWALFELFPALPAYALVLFRITGLMLAAPVFSSSVVPVRVRAALTVMVAAVIFPVVRAQAPAEVGLAVVVVGAAGEIMVGLIMGLALAILSMGVELTGLVVGRQAGIALANIFDPTQNRQVSVIGQVYTIAFTLVFLLAGGHRAVMAALLDTYQVIPLLSFRFDESYVVLLVEMLGAAFILGIRVAGPVLLALFLLGTALAFLSRTMPQLNILTVGFTLRALVALGIAAVAISASGELLLDAVWDGMEMIRSTFGLNPAVDWLVG